MKVKDPLFKPKQEADRRSECGSHFQYLLKDLSKGFGLIGCSQESQYLVDYQELIEELHCTYQFWENSRKKLEDEEIDTDVAPIAVNFCGKCRKCGRIVHKAMDCTNLNGSNSNEMGNVGSLNGNLNRGNKFKSD